MTPNREFTVDGRAMRTFADVRGFLIREVGLPDWVGLTAHALADLLATEVPRPLTLIWEHSEESRKEMGAAFDRIVEELKALEIREAPYAPKAFRLILR